MECKYFSYLIIFLRLIILIMDDDAILLMICQKFESLSEITCKIMQVNKTLA